MPVKESLTTSNYNSFTSTISSSLLERHLLSWCFCLWFEWLVPQVDLQGPIVEFLCQSSHLVDESFYAFIPCQHQFKLFIQPLVQNCQCSGAVVFSSFIPLQCFAQSNSIACKSQWWSGVNRTLCPFSSAKKFTLHLLLTLVFVYLSCYD